MNWKMPQTFRLYGKNRKLVQIRNILKYWNRGNKYFNNEKPYQ